MVAHGAIKDKGTQKAVDNLVSKLRRRQTVGARTCALETVLLLRQVVASARFSSIEQLLRVVRDVGARLVEAQPRETSVGNIVRKVLKVIREEAAGVNSQIGSGANTPIRLATSNPLHSGPISIPTPSLANLVLLGHSGIQRLQTPTSRASQRLDPFTPIGELGTIADDPDASKKAFAMKPALIDAIQEVINELETVYENVAKNAKEYIHPEDIVLTMGKSKTVESFLKSAARDRKFSVIVAETGPSYCGREMAAALADAKISTVLVPDAALFALMSRVNKVVLGAHAVQANGGIIGIAGSSLAAMAARAHSTPVIVCSGQFKLTPSWNMHQQFATLDVGDPEVVLPSTDPNVPEDVDVINPWFDYVPPEDINVLVTNYGDHPPAYVYRLITESYDDEDLEL